MKQIEILELTRRLRPHRSRFAKVRVGTLGDGGYVLPDDLDGISAVLSLGIGDEVSFDLHFAQRGAPVFQYDPTVAGPPLAHENFHFHRLGWGPADGPQSASLQGMIERHGLLKDNHALLKFDTEGAEWGCFASIDANMLKPFRIVVCELHFIFGIQHPEYAAAYAHLIRSLTEFHTVVHLHGNNCCGIDLAEGVPVPRVFELTLLRKDRSDFEVSHEPIPGPLDFPSKAGEPDLVLAPFF